MKYAKDYEYADGIDVGETKEYRDINRMKYKESEKGLPSHKEAFNEFVDNFLSLSYVVESIQQNYEFEDSPTYPQKYNNCTGKYDESLGFDVRDAVSDVKHYFKKKYIREYIKSLKPKPKEAITVHELIEFIQDKYEVAREVDTLDMDEILIFL